MDRLWKEWQHICSSSLARNAGWMFAGQSLSVICQVVYFILLARLLGATEYGIYAGVFAMTSMLSQYSTLGSHTVLLRSVSQEPRNFAPYWGNVLMTTFTLGSVFVLVLIWAVPHLAHSYSWTMVLWVAIADCLCAQLTSAAARAFQAHEKMRVTALLNLLTNLLRALLAGAMLWKLHHGTAQQWAMVVMAVSTIATCTALVFVTREYGWASFSLALLRLRTGEGFVYALSYSTAGISDNIDKAMLGHYGMNAANGIYSMAYRAIDMATVPLSAVQGAAMPRFFRKGSEGAQSTSAYALKIVKRTAPMTVMVIAAMLLAAPMIPRLLGKSFDESISALRWLCLLPLFRSFNLSAGDALTGAGHIKLRLSGLIGAAAFNFAVNLYLIPRYGWLGAAWSSLATDSGLAVLNWLMVAWLMLRAKKTNH